jgi:hypothetical protein
MGHFKGFLKAAETFSPRNCLERSPLYVFPQTKKLSHALSESEVHWYFYVPERERERGREKERASVRDRERE